MRQSIQAPLLSLLIALAFASASSCGARTPLLELASSDAGIDAPIDNGALPDAKPDSVVTEASIDAAPDVQLQHCSLSPVGSPMQLIKFPDQHAEAPSIVALRPGVNGTDTAHVAVQVFASGGSSSEHSSIRIARASVGQDWPSGVVLDQAPMLLGTESHGWGELAHGPGSQLALAWHGDKGGPSRPRFRSLDAASWTAGPELEIAQEGEAVLSIASSGDDPTDGLGTYAAVWRVVTPGTQDSSTHPVVALLDTLGAVVAGPFSASEATEYPGRSASVAWSGTRFLLAQSFPDCTGSLCEPWSVVVARVGEDGLSETAAIASQSAGVSPRRPAIAAWGGFVWVAWFESVLGAEQVTARIARLDAQGTVQAAAVTLANEVVPITRMSLAAGPYGAVATWNEETAAGPALTVLQVDEHLELLSKQQVATTQPGTYGWTSSAMVHSPPSVLVVWYGNPGPYSGLGVTFLARFDCM